MDTIRRLSDDLTVFSDGRDIPEDTLDSFLVALEFCYRELVVLDTLNLLDDIQKV